MQRMLVRRGSKAISSCLQDGAHCRLSPVLTRSLSAVPNAQVEGNTISNRVKACSYAVRGRVLDEAMKIEQNMRAGQKYPFDKLVACNIGNPHAVGQPHLTFNRDVISLCVNPELIDKLPAGTFKKDVVERVRRYTSPGAMSGGMGAYTNSQGLTIVREDVAAFIERRDGHPSAVDKIFLTEGASAGVSLIMQCLLRDHGMDGMLTPIPQYPLYSALLTLLGGKLVPYFLDVRHSWAVQLSTVKESLIKARKEGITVRSICVINPGNPTGSVMKESEIRDVIQLAVDEGLVVLADEVYQENIYREDRPFHSFKKVACDMGYDCKDGNSPLQLVSFHSTSKGFTGECGLRGGYMELHGFPADVKAQLYKLSSVRLCSNTVGQIACGLMVSPPVPGGESYSTYIDEKRAILASLNRKSQMLRAALNQMEGVTCNMVDGAMYAFPSITLPPKALEKAQQMSTNPDEYYCLELLAKTGVILVPGSGFGQTPGTYHFRTTFLPQESAFPELLARLQAGHAEFMKEHA